MPSEYLLLVNSRPQPASGIDDETWESWYIQEHLPDMIRSTTSTRACLYQENYDFALASKERNDRNFLVVYQTDFEEPLKTNEYRDRTRRASDLFPDGKQVEEVGDFDARNYKLIQDYDPDERGETAPPFMLSAEMHPVDEVDFDKWYREEHLDQLHQFQGYIRSARYVLGPRTNQMIIADPPKYIALHEMDNLVEFGNKDYEVDNITPWTLKHMKESKAVVVRGWKLLHAEGF